MLRNRFLILLAVCFLAASAAWADDVGYVDCASHSEGTQVFGKPRKTPDVVANLACGERFTILVYGFYFSRIQTRDGQIGYIYSNLIALDRGVTSIQQVPPQTPQRPAHPAVQQVPSLEMAAEKTKIPHTPPIDADSAPAAPTQPQPAVAPAQPASTEPAPATAQPAVTPTPAAVASSAASTASTSASPAAATTAAEPAAAAAQPNPPASAQPQPEAAAPAPAQPSAPDTTSASTAPAATTPPAQPQPEPARPAAAQPTASSQPPTSTSADASATVADATPPAPQPEPAAPQPAAAQPEAAPAQPAPAPAPIRPADKVETWEKPRAVGRTAPLMELYGGYAFARMGGASNGSNLSGALGSFGWNAKPWLQVVADTSYSFQTIGNTKNVLYGNHFGPRFFYRSRHRWGFTPFVEGLVGGSSVHTTVSGTGGYTASTGSALSYKIGGGIDIHPSRHWDVRLFDVDYYRTTFSGSTQPNNYWISAGVVLRLFGGSAE
jgi:hypothetical protein